MGGNMYNVKVKSKEIIKEASEGKREFYIREDLGDDTFIMKVERKRKPWNVKKDKYWK